MAGLQLHESEDGCWAGSHLEEEKEPSGKRVKYLPKEGKSCRQWDVENMLARFLLLFHGDELQESSWVVDTEAL